MTQNGVTYRHTDRQIHGHILLLLNENHNIAIVMSSSRADPVLPWLEVFKCLVSIWLGLGGFKCLNQK